jgi:hypothetical protein
MRDHGSPSPAVGSLTPAGTIGTVAGIVARPSFFDRLTSCGAYSLA